METISERSHLFLLLPFFSAPHMYAVSTDINNPIYLISIDIFYLFDKILYLSSVEHII